MTKIFTNPISKRGLISKIYKILKKLDINKPIFKMEYRSKQKILNRGISNAGERKNVHHPGHQRNGNQNYLRLHLIPVRMAKIKNISGKLCQQGYGARRTLLHCWWECKLAQPLWKSIQWLLRKLGMDLPQDPDIPLFGIYMKGTPSQQGHLFNHLHNSFIHNIQKLKTIQMSHNIQNR